MSDQDTRPFAEVLASIVEGEDVSVPLLFRLSDLNRDDLAALWARWEATATERRESVVRHLADITESYFQVDFAPIFAHCLEDESAVVRQAALDGLWDCADTRLVPRIIAVMENDAVRSVRAAAARALAHYLLMAEWGQIRAHVKPTIVTALLARWDDDANDLAMRRAVVESLGPAAHERVPEVIEAAYQERQPDLQKSALFAMGSSADPRWLSIVIAEMENPDADIRAEAARAAGAIGRSEAVEGLGELLADEDDDVIRVAITALGQVGSDEARELLQALQATLDETEDETLLELIDEAIAEMEWVGAGVDLSLLDWGADDEDDPDYDAIVDDDLDAGDLLDASGLSI